MFYFKIHPSPPLCLHVSRCRCVCVDNHMGGRPRWNLHRAAHQQQQQLKKPYTVKTTYGPQISTVPAEAAGFESLSKEMYTHKHSYVKTKTVANKPRARTTMSVFSLSLCACDKKVLVCLPCHDDKMINRRALARVRGRSSASSRPRIRPQLSQLCV